MKRLLSLLLLTLTVLTASAQKYTITGKVINENDEKPFELATVRLLGRDDQLIVGTFTDSLGCFTLKTDRRGKMNVYATFVGCEPAQKSVTLAEEDSVDVGVVKLFTSDIALRSAVVAATAARVEQKEDTTMFNASAYRVPDGATLEALIKQFPGIEVTDDGKIKWNGKEVKEFLINGKDFFKGDTDIAMKNLPVNMVKRVKAYGKRSDYSEQTGIDDGEETTVLDIMTKRELNQSFVSNIDLAGGWDWHDHALYSGKVFATHFTDNSRVTGFASRNNVGDSGFGGPRGGSGGGGNNGITTSTMAGFDFNVDNGRQRYEAGRVEFGGNILYRGRDNETESTSSSETFMTNSRKQSFSNSHSWGTSLSHNLSGSLRLMWSPDSLTSVSLRPSYSFSRSKGSGRSHSASFDENPFKKIPGAESTEDVLGEFDWLLDHQGALSASEQERYQQQYPWLVNISNRTTFSESQSHNINGNLNVTRRLTGKAGRNVSLQASGGWQKTESWNYALSNIFTRQRAIVPGQPSPAPSLLPSVPGQRATVPEASASGSNILSPNGTHQFTASPSKNWNASVGGSYVEPLGGKWYGELRYNYSHRFQDTNRSLFDLYSFDMQSIDRLLAHYTGNASGHLAYYTPERNGVGSVGDVWEFTSTDYLNHLLSQNPDDVMAAVRDEVNSQYSTYNYDTHRASIGVRYNTQDINFNASVAYNPERTSLHYNRPGVFAAPIDTVRTVFTINPQVRFRYNFSKTNRLDINYRGSSSQPSMTQLLPVADTSNPLSISAGNVGLKPSWSDTFRLNYNGYNADRQAGTMVNLSATINQRSITTRQITDELSGVSYSRPENISGNWNANGGLNYNIGLGRQKLLTLSTGTNLSYKVSRGYSSAKPAGIETQRDGEQTFDFMNRLFGAVGSQKTKAQTTNVSENLSLAYRRSLWDISANGRLSYMHSVSNAMNARNMDTWGFNYGLTGNVTLDCGLAFSTDIRMNSRRGYNERAMNTNELLWNAQISQSFLKDKSLTVQLQFYDILQQQSNISHTVTALSRTDSWNDAINSYFMVHLIYKLNIFGGKKGADEAPRGDAPRGGQYGPGPGGPGYGSGRPDRQGGDRPGGGFGRPM